VFDDAGATGSIVDGSCRDIVWVIGGCKLLTAELQAYLCTASLPVADPLGETVILRSER
jgi:hypothetical protein